MKLRFSQSMTNLVVEPQAYRYLLTVSGGVDSCVMATLFRDAGLDFAIAHCNFHLRGEESNRDMRHVQAFAQHLGVELFVKEFDTPTLQQHSGLSMEMLARKLRYDWFSEIGGNFDFIVTAHHANDAAETMLLNLTRGTGLKGLCSIPDRNGKLIRPLLDFTSTEILDYAHRNHIQYVEDSSNSDENIKRNRIRHTVIPSLTQLNPNLIHTLSHNCHVFQQQYAFYQRQMDELKRELITHKEGVDSIRWSDLNSHPDRAIILYEILSDYGFSTATIETIRSVLPSGSMFQSSSHTLMVNRDELLIKQNGLAHTESYTFNTIEALQPFFDIEEVHTEHNIAFEKDNNILFLPKRLLSWPVTIRYWQHGDYFYPLGSSGKQKLSDFFTDHKIDRFTKQQIPLFCVGEDIIWIIGYRSDNRYKLTSSDTDYYRITYKNGHKK